MDCVTTSQALEASIKHWEANLLAAENDKPQDIDISSGACALCSKFWSDSVSYADACNGCPVYMRTGERFCAKSPYGDVDRELSASCDGMGNPARLVNACRKQLDFLISLRESVSDE